MQAMKAPSVGYSHVHKLSIILLFAMIVFILVNNFSDSAYCHTEHIQQNDKDCPRLQDLHPFFPLLLNTHNMPEQ